MSRSWRSIEQSIRPMVLHIPSKSPPPWFLRGLRDLIAGTIAQQFTFDQLTEPWRKQLSL